MRPEHFRFKTAEPGASKEWTCCICLHVRTATIMFGLWHMLLHILAMSIMVALLNNPNLLIENKDGLNPPKIMANQIQFGSDQESSDIFADLENEHKDMSRRLMDMGPTRKPDYEILRKQYTRYTDIQSGILITFCTMMMTMALVMGALRSKPSLLMPFFCFQLFDFCLGVLAGFSYLTMMPDVYHIVANSKNIPFQNMLLEMNPNCLAFFLVLSFSCALVIKGYFIRVVWKCYKFLILKTTLTRASIHVIEASVPSYDSQNLLLPGYEAALAKYARPTGPPPPSYDLATATAPPAFVAPPSYQVAIANGAHVILPAETALPVTMVRASPVDMTTSQASPVTMATTQGHSG